MKITKELLHEQGFVHVDGYNCYVWGRDGISVIFGNERGIGRLDYCEIFIGLDEYRSNGFRGFTDDTDQVNAIAKAMGFKDNVFN